MVLDFEQSKALVEQQKLKKIKEGARLN